MRKAPTFLRSILMVLGLAALTAQASAQIGLKIPPLQDSLVLSSMGGAVAADGTFFNATSYNPALLSRAPKGAEAFNLGANFSNDLFGVIDYAQNFNFQADTAFQDLSDGIFGPQAGTPAGDALVTNGLTVVQDLMGHLTQKAAQGGAGLSVALKIGGNFGFQVYNHSQVYGELFRGSLTDQIMAIPLPFDSAVSGALGTQLVTQLQNDLQAGLDKVLSPSEQASIQPDIDDLKNGQIDLDTFMSNVSGSLPGIDPNELRSGIINSMVNDLAIFSALAISDTVAMGTFSFDPWKDLPLTVGLNLKMVYRHIAYASLASSLDAGGVDGLGEDARQGTLRFGLDLGFLYQLKEAGLDLGLSFTDLIHQQATIQAAPGSLLEGVVTDPAPIVARFGASWGLVPGLRVDLDVDDIFSTTSLYEGDHSFGRVKFGAGYKALDFLQVRAGFGNNGIAAGVGLFFGFVGLDYTFASDVLSQKANHYGRFLVAF